MDWREPAFEGGGGYFNENEATTPGSKSGTKSAVRQQFLCPVTIRQVHEAPDDGLKIGNFTATMVTLAGIVDEVDVSSTKVKFTLSDDTGEIDCIEWLESDEGEQPKNVTRMVENTYYQVYGCIKSLQGQRRIMVFKVSKIQNFNEYTAFMAEVISVNQYAEKINQLVLHHNLHIVLWFLRRVSHGNENYKRFTDFSSASILSGSQTDKRRGVPRFCQFGRSYFQVIRGVKTNEQCMPATAVTNENNFGSFKIPSFTDNRTAFNPVQQAILDEIKMTEDQIGWSRKNSALNSRFPKKAIEDALDFLISEGHIYSTIDDDHFCST